MRLYAVVGILALIALFFALHSAPASAGTCEPYSCAGWSFECYPTSNLNCCAGLDCNAKPPNGYFCDSGEQTCVTSGSCSVNADCCSGHCIECNTDDDCGGVSQYSVHRCVNNVCVACTSDADCQANMYPYDVGQVPVCTSSNICILQCTDAYCQSTMGADYFCNNPPDQNGACIQCLNDGDCIPSKTCQSNTCVDRCGAGETWNETSGSCQPTPVGFCGDGIIQPLLGEVCDGNNLDSQTCVSKGFAGGSLSCANDCKSFDTSACTLNTYYRDSDSDGYGDAGSSTTGASAPQGYVSDKTDCNDGDAAIYPGATEVCNGVDDNCNGMGDEPYNTYYQDSDSDTYGNAAVSTQACSAPPGYVVSSTDCNDNNPAIHPGAAEVCNGIDNNCVNGTADEVNTTYYRDADADTYGNASSSTSACSAPAGYVADKTDCNDATGAAHPGLAESCSDTIDNNCDGTRNEGCVENTLAQCNDGVDNDVDGQTDFADATPTYVAAGSCNICNAAACQGVGGVPLAPSVSMSDPGAPAGYVSFDATTNNGGNAFSYRIDDGSLSPADCWCKKCDEPSYAWNASSNKCEPTQPLDCSNPNSAPTVNQFTATAFYGGYANDDVTLYLDGTVTVGPGNFQIDTDGNVGNGYEVSSNNDFSTFVSNLGAGTYTFNAKVTEGASCLTPRSATSQVQITINPNSAPTVSLSNTVTPHWLNSSVTFDFMVSDEKPNIAYTIDFGDGTSYNANTGGSNSVSGSVTHTYLSEGSFTARITATDAGTPALQGTTTSNVNSVFLDCVQGSQTGTPTYTNDASQCCSETNPQNPTNAVSCSAPVAGWQNCFATTSCYPGQGTICSTVLGQPTPTMWRNRDYDQTHCTIAPTQTCNSYPWTDYANASLPEPYCCGDDNGEVLAVRVFGGGSACCPGANQCYTTVGASPGCYDGIENTLAKCSNGNDDDCDGLVDIADTDCQPAQISGHVTIDDGSPLVGIDVNITINGVTAHKVTDTNGYYSFTAGDLVGAAIGNHNVYAYKFGYTTEKETINFAPGNTYTVDFTLHGRRCNDDCTNDQGYCDSSCVGVGACNPTPVERQTLDACHPQGAPFGLRKGTEVVLDTNETSQQMLVGICCSVAPSWRSAPAVTVVDAGSIDVNMQKIDTLVKYTRLITLNGKTYRLVISTW